MVTVLENCCIVSDSLCHGRHLLLSLITGFVISQITQTKLDIKKLTRLTKQVFFGECLNYFCP